MSNNERERYNRSLQGVLQFALDNYPAQACREVTPVKVEEMEVERRLFLQDALKSLTVDVIEELEKAITTINAAGSTDPEKVDALNVIRDYASDIDFANNLIQIGAMHVILRCLSDGNAKIRICSAYVVAELAQNNPFCQQHLLEANTLQILMRNLSSDEDIASSFLHAISTLVRNFEPGCVKFVELDGLKFLLDSLRCNHSKVFVKACFLLRALSTEYTSIRDKFVKLGAINQLSHYVDPVTDFDIKTEIVLSALSALTETEDGQLCLLNTSLFKTLQAIVEQNEGKPESEEMVADAKTLLNYFSEDKSELVEK